MVVRDAPTQPRPRAIRLLVPVALALLVWMLPLAPEEPKIGRMAAVAVLMAGWWITGALPLAATALVPLVAYPLAGIASAQDTAGRYINDTIFLFMGGFILALAMERWGLHQRIAVSLLTLAKWGIWGVLLGFFAASFFLSMWISNTACAMLLVPMALAILQQGQETTWGKQTTSHPHAFAAMVLLSIAYGASIGGTATLIGTPPNLSFVRISTILFPQAPVVSFGQWLLFALPLAVLVGGAAVLLLWLFFGREAAVLLTGENPIHRLNKEQGPLTWEERCVAAVFVLVAVLWVTRTGYTIGGRVIPGWEKLLPHGRMIQDGTVEVLGALLLFILPSRRSESGCVMDWVAAKALPWDVILLLGGGFALAGGFTDTGLDRWLANQLLHLEGVPVVILLAGLLGTATFLTEFTSNTSTAEMLLPVVGALAASVHIHPFYVMPPVTIACSYAFALPIATPPNAIVFATGHVRVWDMLKVGLALNVVSLILALAYMTWIAPFTLGVQPSIFPEWAAARP